MLNCKNDWKYLHKSAFLFSKWPIRREVKMGQKIFEVFWQEEEEAEVYVASWARWDAQWKGLVELERRCQDISREIQMLSQRQERFKNAIEGKLRVQGRASERLQDQIVEEIKEMEHKRTEEALELVRKENDLDKRRSKKIAGRQETWKG